MRESVLIDTAASPMPMPDIMRSLLTADCSLLVDRTLTVVWCNGLAADLFGVERGSVLDVHLPGNCGISWSDEGNSPVELDKLELGRVWEGETVSGLEVCVNTPRAGGDAAWLEIGLEPVFAPETGSVSAALVLGQDVTARRHALRGLQDVNATLTALVQASPLPILAFGTDGNITYWNRASEIVFGWQATEVLGRPVPFIPRDKIPEHQQMRQQDLSGSMLVNREIRRMRKDGEPIDLSVSTAPIRDRKGAVSGTICVYIDISERKRLEEQLWQSSRMESLGVLAGGVAHDFNNLLTSILGNASLALQEAAADSDQELALRNVIDACDRAVVLTGKMLAYSGKGRFNLTRVDLSELVREMRPLVESSLGAGVTPRFDLREHLPLVHCDPQQIQQVVVNIVLNAGEAISGCGEVALSTFAASPPESPGVPAHVCIEVTDTGCGMNEDTRSRMFDPFFSTKFTGRGLGLAAVIGIVRGHKGVVQVQSAVGQGTCFRVFLPAAPAGLPG